MTEIELSIPTQHPAYRGHFPGRPVLPGVVLLDATLQALGNSSHEGVRGWEINSAKFQSAVRPGEALTLRHETLPNGSIRFSIRAADRTVASGTLVAPAAAR
jgi:3-hydroxymyristoyl/3-hydroxydecanoyl-(acyl carrier protein) dehydratase